MPEQQHPVTNGPISVSVANNISSNDQKAFLATSVNDNQVSANVEFFAVHLQSAVLVVALALAIALLCCCWRCSKRKNWSRIAYFCCVNKCRIDRESLDNKFEIAVCNETESRPVSSAEMAALDLTSFLQQINDRSVAAAAALNTGGGPE